MGLVFALGFVSEYSVLRASLTILEVVYGRCMRFIEPPPLGYAWQWGTAPSSAVDDFLQWMSSLVLGKTLFLLSFKDAVSYPTD